MTEVNPEQAKQPEAKQPEVKQPEVKQPEAKQPEVKQPEVKQPEAKKPEVKPTETKPPSPNLEEQTNCPVCNKHLKKIKRYYRNGKYYCGKRCWLKESKKKKEEAKSGA